MDQDLAPTIESLVDESIGDAEVLLNILLRLIVDLQVQVLEVAVALSVRLAGDIQDVSDAGFNQLTCLEGALEGAHVDASVHLEQADVADGLLTVDIACAEVDVREASASDLLLSTAVVLTVIVLASTSLLLVDGDAAEARISVHLLELGD